MTNQPKPAPTAPREYAIPDEECLPKYFKEPAPTAEEQMLPPYVVTEDDKSKASQMLPNPLNTALMSRERQLLAALRSNREKDAQLADRDNHLKYAYAALGDVNTSVYVFDHIHKLKSELAENDAKIAELEKDVASSEEQIEALEQKYEGCPHKAEFVCACSYDFKSDVCAVHAPALRAARAQLRAVSEAIDWKLVEETAENEFCDGAESRQLCPTCRMTRMAQMLLSARLRSIVDGKD